MDFTITREGFGKMVCKTCNQEVDVNSSFYEGYDERTGIQDFEHEKCLINRISPPPA